MTFWLLLIIVLIIGVLLAAIGAVVLCAEIVGGREDRRMGRD